MSNNNAPATKDDVERLLNVLAKKSDIKQLETKMDGHFEAFNKSLNNFMTETRLKFDFMNEFEISKNWSSKSNWKV